MSIHYYNSPEETAFNVENADEVFEALDVLHSQVLDNLGSDPRQEKLLAALEAAMNQVDEVRG